MNPDQGVGQLAAESMSGFSSQVLDHIPDGVVVATNDGCILYANRALHEIFGYEAGVLVGSAAAALLSHAACAPETLAEQIFSALKARMSWAGDVACRRQDGREFWLQAKVNSVRHASLGWVTVYIVRDVTGQLETRSELRAERSRVVELTNHVQSLQVKDELLKRQAVELDDLYNRAPCGYHSLDANGVIQKINDTELQWLGFAREDVVGKKRVTEFLSPDSVKTFELNFPRLLSDGSINQLEMEFIRRDGTIFPVLVSATLIRDAQGRPVGTRSVLQDYSHLRQQRETLRRVLTASPMAVRIASVPDSRVLFMNEAFCRLVRRDEEQARGLNVRDYYVDQSVFDDIVAHLRRGETVMNRLIELWLPDIPEEPHVWALASYMPIVYEGTPAALAWLFDVTELQQARAAAEEGMRAKASFLANMSHEIRTPLNGMLGMGHLIRRDPLSAEQGHRLDTLMAAGNHLLSIINDILDISKIDAGKLTLDVQPLQIDTLVGHVAAMVHESAHAKGLRLSTDLGAMPAGLTGDATRLQQCLLNYANNAVKFTEHGSITLRVRTLLDDDHSALLRFEVEDTGSGIEADVIQRLFGEFEQGDASSTRKVGGTGLGLAITRKLARMMGGDAGVRSQPGQGSLFWFTARLSKSAGTVGVPAGTAPEDLAATLRQRFAGTRVLLAEDNEINLEVAKVLLEDAGMVVETAINGSEAVARADPNLQRLVLMDMQMPGMDGLEATRVIRATVPSARLPIVAMTANAFDADRERCREAGMDDFISKPVMPEDLYAILLRWLSRENTVREA